MEHARIRIAATAVLCAMLGAGAAQAADMQVAREYTAEVALDIGTNGQVTKAEVPADVPAMLVAPAQATIERWRFRPPVRNGHAVTARTYAHVTLQVVRQPGGDYGLRVVFGSNGPKLIYTQLPLYPRDEIRHRGEGRLTMQATVQPDGRLTDITVASYRINHPDPAAFRQAAEASLSGSHAAPELVDGKPVATRIQIPIVFALNRVSPSQALSRQAGKTAVPAKTSPGQAPSAFGQMVALDSPVKLVTGRPPG